MTPEQIADVQRRAAKRGRVAVWLAVMPDDLADDIEQIALATLHQHLQDPRFDGRRSVFAESIRSQVEMLMANAARVDN